LNEGYEGVEHFCLSETMFGCMSAKGAGYTSLGRSPRKLAVERTEG
jgi:hypothetical protein